MHTCALARLWSVSGWLCRLLALKRGPPESHGSCKPGGAMKAIKFVSLLVVVALALAGCGTSVPSTGPAATAAPAQATAAPAPTQAAAPTEAAPTTAAAAPTAAAAGGKK